MKIRWISLIWLVAFVALLMPAPSRADVRDNAKIFSKQAVDDANHDMRRMEKNHNKQLVVETFASIPDDQKAEAQANSEAFFKKWTASQSINVNGVYVLICMNPRHLEVKPGLNTLKRGDFTEDNSKALRTSLLDDLRDANYDKALSTAVDTVERDYSDNIHGVANRNINANQNAAASPTPPLVNHPLASPNPSSSLFTGVGTLVCLAVGAVIIFSLIRSVFRGNSGGGFGGGNYGGGNYGGGTNFGNQGYGGNPGGNFGGGGFGGGGGSGFGKGFLGGLLGGAIGGYAADKFDHRNDNDQTSSNAGFFGGGGQSDNSGNSGGGGSSFDSGPSDVGQSSDFSAGGDFGSSSGGDSGGGDSGGGGGDSGGSSGGDF